ncbi:replication associated protein [Microviridae sp.]|nr:replication associated protein [Microviridae sp.]
MRCTDPRTVGFLDDGKTISWSQKTYSKEYATFQLPCGQCLACRLEYARQWAVRCIHEAQMHEKNCFITLTYADEHLPPKLQYDHFQDFMKRLRTYINDHERGNKTLEETQIGFFVTGEYGDKTKRPHWHAIIFNWSPADAVPKYITNQNHQVFSSKTLDTLWGKGITEFGSVTLDSAGYCARYAAKKLSHGRDKTHDYEPISKKSSRQAIGKKFIQKHFESVFNLGFLVLEGEKLSIPRYYEKWLKNNEPNLWRRYVTQKKLEITNKAKEKNERQMAEEKRINENRRPFAGPVRSKKEAQRKILKSKFKQLKTRLG